MLLGLAPGRAQGTLLAKVDDDDTYGTEHIWDLVLARHYSGATLVGKGTEFVYLETLDTTVRRPSGVPEATGELVTSVTADRDDPAFRGFVDGARQGAEEDVFGL